MIEGRDLLFYGGDWNRFPSGFQQIADLLAKKNRILWVGSVSIRRPRLQIYDVERIVGRVIDLFKVRHAQSKTLLAANIHPIVIPFYDIPGVQHINDMLIRKAIMKAMRELNFKDVISFPSTPMVANLVGTFGETSSHYFCMDDYTQYDGVYRCVDPLEKKTLEKVDTSFALSEPLMQTRKAKTGETHYLPMGVEIEHFQRDTYSVPPELKDVKGPIAGFFGQIGSYVDIDLIVQCAKSYPDVTFVVIGKPQANIDTSIFTQAKNIMFLGERPYEQIPYYAHLFDIGLNPRVVNKLSLAMNPVKLLEYMSLGMPVVSTDLPAVKPFSNVVNIAASWEHFVELIGTALKDKDVKKREERMNIAAQYSWEQIVENISEVILRIDAAKRSSMKVTAEHV